MTIDLEGCEITWYANVYREGGAITSQMCSGSTPEEALTRAITALDEQETFAIPTSAPDAKTLDLLALLGAKPLQPTRR